MNRIELSALGGDALVRADLAIGAGIHTVVAITPSGGGDIVRFVSGLSRPQYGTVMIDGEDPFSHPTVRRKIGSLLAVEEGMETRTVEAGVAHALDLRGSSKSAAAALDAFGLGPLAKRSPSSLPPGEARAVALALALAAAEGGVLALFEPLATAAGRARVVAAIADAAKLGASVLCVTASVRDAGDLGGRSFPLRFGRIGGETPLSSLVLSGPSAFGLCVRTDDPRRLIATLSLDPAFSALQCDLAEPGEIVVTGAEPDIVSLAVLRGARQSGAKILALWQHAGFAAGAPAAGRKP